MAIRKEPKSAGALDSSARIHEVAYYRWEERGRPCGTALDDWLYAEAVLAAPEVKKAPAAPRKRADKAVASAGAHG